MRNDAELLLEILSMEIRKNQIRNSGNQERKQGRQPACHPERSEGPRKPFPTIVGKSKSGTQHSETHEKERYCGATRKLRDFSLTPGFSPV